MQNLIAAERDLNTIELDTALPPFKMANQSILMNITGCRHKLI